MKIYMKAIFKFESINTRFGIGIADTFAFRLNSVVYSKIIHI